MDETVLNKIKELTEKAKEKGRDYTVEVHLASGSIDSLNKAIKTKEQAEEFMRNLKAL